MVYDHPSERTSLADAAALCGLSAGQFNRLFREAMGISFGRFHLQERVALAAYLLLTTNFTVDAVSLQTGFSSASHLHHTFAKHYGCTPAEYRRRFRE